MISKNILKVFGKSGLLSFGIFWIIFLSKEARIFYLGFIIISIIPIIIVSTFTISISILPFFALSPNLSNKEIFKRYFPYYSIITFIILAYYIFMETYNNFTTAFYTSAFITLMQAWIWLCKRSTIEEELKNRKREDC